MTGIIILAAGESSRLGQPKQNLLFRGKTLLQHAVAIALNTGYGPVMVVLGANADKINIEPNAAVVLLHNTSWQEGMASSVRLGVEEMMKHEVDEAFMMLCDQPFVNDTLLRAMRQKKQKSGQAIVACSYKGTIGVPVLFDKIIFADLLLLEGHEGAKKILQQYARDTTILPFDEGGIDIDTPADYEDLISRHSVN